MNREQFLESLKTALKGLPEMEVRDILEDYQMHFQEGTVEGRAEADIARTLGDPIDIGRMFRADFMVAKAGKSATFRNVAGAAMAVVGLGLFNLLFVAGPVSAVFLALLTVWMLLVVLALVSVTVIVASVFYALFPSFFVVGGVSPFLLALGVFFLGIGALSLSAILAICMGFLTRFCFRLLADYLKFNLEVIQKRRSL
ncbi:MAG: hypothetical protein DRJ14_07435 [Acidobacteria bacterium]|nr:MAG: hypothetical protein DRJ14_07435 [Acidobacteriota bacterium]